jgi:hypothetical protein
MEACPICGMEFDNEDDCYKIHLPDCEAEQEESAHSGEGE